jgi:hypothetical protein
VRERLAVLTFTALILGGGLFPQPGVESRRLAVERVLKPLREDAQIGKRGPQTDEASEGNRPVP